MRVPAHQYRIRDFVTFSIELVILGEFLGLDKGKQPHYRSMKPMVCYQY
jgi:hypothetical protein